MDSGKLIITCPESYCDGYINLCVNDEYGYSAVRIIRFHESRIEFPAGLEYSISSSGGNIAIPFSVNFNYSVKVDEACASWLSLTQGTKAGMRDERISLTVQGNSSSDMRQGKVYIHSEYNEYEPYAEIIVNQASAVFFIDKTNHAIPAEGGRATSNIKSSLGLDVRVPEEVSWLKTQLESGGEIYSLSLIAESNDSDSRRECSIQLYSGDGETLMGTITVIQFCRDAEEPSDMVFIVRANYINDFTAHLPLSGEVDCYVDWGDGSADYFNSGSNSDQIWQHRYNTYEPASYTVRISGKVTALNSDRLDSHSVIEVVQWGNTGLATMHKAFLNNTMLKKIAEDTRGAFSDVGDFSQAFNGCLSIKEIPAGLFNFGQKVHSCDNTFRSTGITAIPGSLLWKCKNLSSVESMFSNCESLQDVPGELFKESTKISNVLGLFRQCNALEALPGKLFSYTPEITSIDDLCLACGNLKTIPAEIFDNNLKLRSFNQSFMWCGKLSGESPYTVILGAKVHLYERISYPDYFLAPVNVSRTFEGTALSDLADMPSAWSSL